MNIQKYTFFVLLSLALVSAYSTASQQERCEELLSLSIVHQDNPHALADQQERSFYKKAIAVSTALTALSGTSSALFGSGVLDSEIGTPVAIANGAICLFGTASTAYFSRKLYMLNHQQ